MTKKAICYESARGSSSEDAFHEADDFSKPQTICGCETVIVTLLAIRLRRARTSQVAIDAIIQKLLAFWAELVVGIHYQAPAVNVESLHPFMFLTAVGTEVSSKVQKLPFGLLASRRRSASD